LVKDQRVMKTVTLRMVQGDWPSSRQDRRKTVRRHHKLAIDRSERRRSQASMANTGHEFKEEDDQPG